MNEADADLLTIAEAAKVLGVPETSLRRALKTLPGYAARTLSQRRQTATGERVATVLPPDLIADLREHFGRQETGKEQAKENAANNAANNGTETAPEQRQNAAVTALPVAEGELPAAAYREIIARLERENGRLWEALRQSQENLAREQALRALPPAQNTPQEAPGGDSTGDRVPGGVVTPPDAPQGEKRGFFSRLFGRRNEAK